MYACFSLQQHSAQETQEEPKTVLGSLRDVVMAPISAITETIQTAVSNLQSDTLETATVPSAEPLSTDSPKV